MTHDKLLAKLWEEIKHCGCDDGMGANCHQDDNKPWNALRAVVEVVQGYERFAKNRPAESDTEKSFDNGMSTISRMVIQAIEKELR